MISFVLYLENSDQPVTNNGTPVTGNTGEDPYAKLKEKML